MKARYVPLSPLPAGVGRLELPIEMSESGFASLLRVLEELEYRAVPCIMCFAGESDRSATDYAVGVVPLHQIEDFIADGGTQPNDVVRIGDLDFLVLQSRRLVDDCVTRINLVDGEWVFE